VSTTPTTTGRITTTGFVLSVYCCSICTIPCVSFSFIFIFVYYYQLSEHNWTRSYNIQ